MFGNLFILLFGDILLVLLYSLPMLFKESSIEGPIDPEDAKFFKDTAFMFPQNFVERYPHEAYPFRLKIFTYLFFNLLVKGYGSIDPGKAWSKYNGDDYNRVLIDAVFYEYLSNFTNSQNKDFAAYLSETTERDLLVSTEEIAVDRIGQYLDDLSQTESKAERFKDDYEFLSEPQPAECEHQTVIQASGLPGTDFPNFCDIPETSFSCNDKRIPGIYADFETGCQAFHVCWPHRLDSFLCPIGTIFNQSLLTCDIWHATGCYSSPKFFERDQFVIDGVSTVHDVPEYDGSCQSLLNKHLLLNTKFLPAKCKITALVDGKKVLTKPNKKDAGDFQMRLETAYNMVREMLSMLREIRKELADELKNRGTPWIHVLTRNLDQQSVSKPSTGTKDENAEYARKIGETELKPSKSSDHVNHLEKSTSRRKTSHHVTKSTLIKPSKSLGDHIEDSKRQDVPEIVTGSLRLGGSILNGGIIPLAKQVMIDSYRKIESNKF